MVSVERIILGMKVAPLETSSLLWSGNEQGCLCPGFGRRGIASMILWFKDHT